MSIIKATETTLLQLKEVLSDIDEEQYRKPIQKLGQSSIGQHVRHTLEFYQCLLIGTNDGIVNYDKRDRNLSIESSPEIAINLIDEILTHLDDSLLGKTISLEVCYELNKEAIITIDSNFSRELVYNIEHAIHHMAIIKIAIIELELYINIPEGFGIAVSTLKYRNSLN